MSTAAFGQAFHGLLEHFEKASLKLRTDGFSQYTSDRVGLFVTLCAHKWSIFDAWAMVNEYFPPDPLLAGVTQPAGAEHPAQDQTSTQPERI